MKRKFKNIYKKKIRVFTKTVKPNEVITLDVPIFNRKKVTNTTLTGEKYWNLSKWNEINNLISQKYIQEIKL